jgi:hypothetical protein
VVVVAAVDLETLLNKLNRERRELRSGGALDGDALRRLSVLDTYIPVLDAALSIVTQNCPTERRPNPRRGLVDPHSNIGLTVAVLREAETPLHVRDIIERIKIRDGRIVKLSSLTPRLVRLAKAGRLFKWHGPSTFGLTDAGEVMT